MYVFIIRRVSFLRPQSSCLQLLEKQISYPFRHKVGSQTQEPPGLKINRCQPLFPAPVACVHANHQKDKHHDANRPRTAANKHVLIVLEGPLLALGDVCNHVSVVSSFQATCCQFCQHVRATLYVSSDVCVCKYLFHTRCTVVFFLATFQPIVVRRAPSSQATPVPVLSTFRHTSRSTCFDRASILHKSMGSS